MVELRANLSRGLTTAIERILQEHSSNTLLFEQGEGRQVATTPKCLEREREKEREKVVVK